MLSLHDIPGTAVAFATLPALAAKTIGGVPILVAPFDCSLKAVNAFSTTNWEGVNNTTDYNQIVISKNSTGIGTVAGSPTGTVITADTLKAVYTGPVDLDKGDIISASIGTVGAGTTAAPAFLFESRFTGR